MIMNRLSRFFYLHPGVVGLILGVAGIGVVLALAFLIESLGHSYAEPAFVREACP